jgi:peptidyl-tRNA hydrolase
MKIGIGRNPAIPPEEYVLSRFQKEEMEELTDIVDRTVDALNAFVFEGKEKAMSMFNRSW